MNIKIQDFMFVHNKEQCTVRQTMKRKIKKNAIKYDAIADLYTIVKAFKKIFRDLQCHLNIIY